MFLKILLFTILSTTMISCGGKKSETTKANVLILSGIASGIPSMTGGTKIYGINAATQETLNLTYHGQTSINLSNGPWQFYAVTWDGDANNDSTPEGEVLQGKTYCGQNQVFLNGGDAAVNMTLSMIGCNDDFFGSSETKDTDATGKFKIFEPVRCLDEKGVSSGTTCQKSVAESYQVQLPDGMGGGPGLTSSCIDTGSVDHVMNNASANIRIPLISYFDASFVVRVRLFDDPSCTGSVQEYDIFNPYRGFSAPFFAKFDEENSNGKNQIRFHNDPCLNGEGTGVTPFNFDTTKYQICTANQFINYIDTNSTTLSYNYYLGRDLDFATEGVLTTSLVDGDFTGTFNGNRKKLSNITINATSPTNLGIFKKIIGSAAVTEVEDLYLQNIDITSDGGYGIGALIGIINSNVNIRSIDASDINITLTSPSTGPYNDVGGLIGNAFGGTGNSEIYAIKMNNVNISLEDYWEKVGGILGSQGQDVFLRSSAITNVSITATGSTAGNMIGGAVGYSSPGGGSSEIYGVIVTELSIGDNLTSIDNARNMIGGLVGKASNTRILDSKATGEIFADGAQIGGLIGFLYASANLEVKGNISDTEITNSQGYMTGGLIGKVQTATTGTTTIESNRSLGPIHDCTNSCGGLIGELTSAASTTVNVFKSYSKSNLTTSSNSGTAKVGGLIGYFNAAAGTGIIDETFYKGTISATGGSVDQVSGFIGNGSGGTVNDSYSLGELYIANSSNSNSGGLFGYKLNTVLNRLYFAGSIDNGENCIGAKSGGSETNVYYEGTGEAQCTGLAAGATEVLTNLGSFSGTLWKEQGSGLQVILKSQIPIESIGESYTGSYLDPILLNTPEQWNAIGSIQPLMNKSFKLNANISFSNSCHIPIGSTTYPFKGRFNGNNFTISDISCNETSGGEPLGLFRKIGTDSTSNTGKILFRDQFDYNVKNSLYIDNVHLSTTQGALGILAGEMADFGTGHEYKFAVEIENVHITNSSVTQNGSFATGGLLGSSIVTNEFTRIKSASFSGDIITSAAPSFIGGIIGDFSGVTATTPTGTGIELERLSFSGSFNTPSANYVGGLIGRLAQDFTQVKNSKAIVSGTMSANNYIGGFVGQHRDSEIYHSYAQVDNLTCSSTSCYIGGFAGWIDGNTTSPISRGNYVRALSVSTASNTQQVGCFGGKLDVTPIIYNNVAFCDSISGGSASSYFANGAFSLTANPSNVFVRTDAEVVTGAIKATPAQILDPTHAASAQLSAQDPWIHFPGSPPKLYWVAFPEALEND